MVANATDPQDQDTTVEIDTTAENDSKPEPPVASPPRIQSNVCEPDVPEVMGSRGPRPATRREQFWTMSANGR